MHQRNGEYELFMFFIIQNLSETTRPKLVLLIILKNLYSPKIISVYCRDYLKIYKDDVLVTIDKVVGRTANTIFHRIVQYLEM